MTKAKLTARRFRRVLLVVGIVYTAAALFWPFAPYLNEYLGEERAGLMGTPLAPFLDLNEWSYGVIATLAVGLVLLAQWAFLRPGRVWTARLTTRGKPLKSAVIAAAGMAMLLTIGAVALILELPDWWEKLIDQESFGVWVLLWLAMLLVWLFWAWVFFVYWRQGDRYTQLGRMIRGLLAGSLLEALVALPVHIWAANQRECYCARGSYTALVFSGTVLLWAFGPGIVLLFLHEHYRRMRLYPRCLNCGYQLTGNTSGTCPECGEKTPAQPDKVAYPTES